MKCKNKLVTVNGIISKDLTEPNNGVRNAQIYCIVTNDAKGKTISVSAEGVQFIIPFEPLEKYLM